MSKHEIQVLYNPAGARLLVLAGPECFDLGHTPGKTAINPTEGTFQSCATCAEEFARAAKAGEDPFEAIGKLRDLTGPSTSEEQA